ncbi:MAG: glycosyltransferase family 4 protein [Patescibacteria group bacterium]
MRILFISQYYPPEIGAAANRIGYFAEYMAKAGHEVSVLTSVPNYPEGKIYSGFKNKFTVHQQNGVTVYRTRIFFTQKTGALSRLAHYLSFVSLSHFSHRKIPKPDVIIATSPPLFTGIIGVLFKKRWKVKLITDIRDIWPDSAQSVGMVKNRGLLKQGQRLANWIYKNSDHLTVTSPGIQKNLPHNVHKKISIIPNAAELELFRPDINAQHIQKQWNLKNKFVVLYTGNLGLAQAPEIFIKAAEELKNEKDILFLMVGSGVFLPQLQEQAQQKNLTNITFTGIQSRAHMPEFVASANVCIIPYKAADTFRRTYPSKMFDYMAGAKPIIINLEGEASELIEKAKCGLLAKEEDAHDLAQKILELKAHPDHAKKMGQAGRKFVEKNFRREVVAKNFEALLLTR